MWARSPGRKLSGRFPTLCGPRSSRPSSGASSSPNRLAHELDVPLATVAHHVIVLRDLGAIELTTTEQRRGATEHFYRARWKVRFEVEPVD